jgi:hypothetical protein
MALYSSTAPARESPSPPPLSPVLTRVLSLAVVVGGIAVLVAWLMLAVVHLNDRYQVDHVGGVRAALAQYVNRGTLYPALFDGEYFGGTRFMPLPIVLHAALARVTGEYLVSGKLLSYGSMAGLLVALCVVLRNVRCPIAIAIGLVAMVVSTPTGLGASFGLRADTLPLLLQVLAVASIRHPSRRWALGAAAVLAALALFSKLHAVWAPLAIGLWLLTARRYAGLALFGAVYGLVAAGLFGVFTAVSQGRIVDNLLGLSIAGIDGPTDFARAPYILVRLMVEQATGAWVLVPVAAIGAWLGWPGRQQTLWPISFAMCLIVLLVVLTDIGAGWNQLIDVVVLVAILVGQLAARANSLSSRAMILLLIMWVNIGAFAETLAPDAQQAFAVLRGTAVSGASVHPLAGLATAGTAMLAEDPFVPVSLGQRPTVLDPFMLVRIGRRDRSTVQSLIERIRAREFELVVLVEPLQPVDRSWWTRIHFGADVVEALASTYVASGRASGYYLYRPGSERAQ